MINKTDFKMKRNFEEAILKVIKAYKGDSTEPLNGDEIDKLIEEIKIRIMINEGDITMKGIEDYKRATALEKIASAKCWEYCYENGLTDSEQAEYDRIVYGVESKK